MLFLPIIVSIFSLIFAYFLIREVKKAPSGQGKMVEVVFAIREGAIAFLKRQYKTVSLVAIPLFFLLWIALGFKVGIGFLIGAAASGLAGFLGTMVSTEANLKVAQAAKSGLKPAFDLAFKRGSVTGFLVVGLGLLSVSIFYLLTKDFTALIALCFGASLIAIFARLGGGIYTKAVEIGAEDDHQNPAVIADQVGDNIGDCAGLAGDMFQTYVIALVAAMLLGSLIFPNLPQAIFLPLLLASLAILASIIATYFVKLGKNQNILFAFYKSLIGAGILSALGFLPIIFQSAPILKFSPLSLYLPALIGLILAFFIFLITDFFTSKKYSPVKSIASASQTGHGANVIAGLAVGMKSTLIPVILISIGILISFALAGMYGLAICVVSMLSLTGLSFCRPIVTKGYAICSAGLAALVLFWAYAQELLDLGLKVEFPLEDPKVLVSLFVGGLIAYYFATLSIEAVSKAASKMVEAALLPVIFPILVGFILGPKALGGLLIGSIIVGIFLAIFVPAINPMIKILNIVALLIVSFLV